MTLEPSRVPPSTRVLRVLALAVALGLFTLGLIALRPGPARAADGGLTIQLAQDSESSRIGTTLVLTATVRVAGAGAAAGAGWAVEFSSSDGWSSGPLTTGSDGTATYASTSVVPETETLTAEIVTAGCSDVEPATVSHDWWQPTLSLDFEPDSAGTGVVGVLLTASLMHGSEGVGGVDLGITATNGSMFGAAFARAAGDPVGPQTTDDQGRAQFRWFRAPGTYDTILVEELGATIPAQASAVYGFAGQEGDYVGLDLEGSPATNTGVRYSQRAGTELTVHASLRNLTVTPADPGQFYVQAFDEQGKTVTDVRGASQFDLDDNGAVDITFSHAASAAAGMALELIQRGFEGGDSVQDTGYVAVTWWQPSLTLQPLDAASPVGGTAAVTATLAHSGQPVPDTRLDAVAGAGEAAPEISAGYVTDTDGHATFNWTRSDPIGDYVAFDEQAPAGADAVGARTTWTWQERSLPVPLTVSLSQSNDTSEVGSSVALVAEVTVDADKSTVGVSGLPVQIAADPSGFRSGELVTGEDGRADTAYASPAAGTDTLVATVSLGGCDPIPSAAITHRWTARPSSPPSTSTPPASPSTVTPSRSSSTPSTPTPIVETSTPVTESPTLTESPTTPVPSTPSSSEPSTSTPETPTESPSPTPEPTPTDHGEHGSDTGHPGGDVTVVGSGCAPGGAVTVFLGATQIGHGTADAEGRFAVRAVVPDIPLGRYQVRSSCGTPVQAVLDLTVSRSAGAPGAAVGATTAGILAFFVLVGNAVLHSVRRS